MFSKIRQRFRDMRTIKQLCELAEKYANAEGQRQPGAEHFILAAIDLPDGTANRALTRVNVTAQDFRSAVERQYQEALAHIGVDMPDIPNDALPLTADKKIYDAQPSAQALMQQLARQQTESGSSLQGAHVLVVAANAEYGVVARAFQILGVDQRRLAEAAKEEVHAVA